MQKGSFKKDPYTTLLEMKMPEKINTMDGISKLNNIEEKLELEEKAI